jgi:hypothetical protein
VGLLVVLALALAACTPGPVVLREPTDPPTPDQVQRALRFAALAPLPADGTVTKLDVQGGIDTRVVLVVIIPDAAPWRAASGLPADGEQQRVANPDGAVVYRSVASTPGGVTVTAFTT